LLLRSSGSYLGLEESVVAGLELCLSLCLSLEEGVQGGEEFSDSRLNGAGGLSRLLRFGLFGRRPVGGVEAGSRYEPATASLYGSSQPAGGEVSADSPITQAEQVGHLLDCEVVSAQVRYSNVEPARRRASGRR